MANERAERKGWRTILGGASNDATERPAQPKQADAEDLIAHIHAAQRRVKSTHDAHQAAIDELDRAQARLHDYLHDTGIGKTVEAIITECRHE